MLANYADQGHGVVLATFTFQQNQNGRISTHGYDPILDGGSAYTSSSLGTHDSSSPIFAGVTTLSASMYRGDGTGVDSGATLVGSWADGKPLVAVNATGHVAGITLFPNVVTYQHATGDYRRLFANTLAYTATGGHSAVPEPGSMALLIGMGMSGAGFLSHRKRTRK